ncbi:MAG: calcium-binding protein [Nitrosomonas sp.]
MAIIQGDNNSNNLNGTVNNDTIYGYGGDDNINASQGGSDILYGGSGDDFYTINSGEQIIENLNEGFDIVSSTVNFTLPANVEMLLLSGSAVTGNGNSLDNFISASLTHTNTGVNNTLNGFGGNDQLKGGDKHDTLNGGDGNDLLIGDAETFTTDPNPAGNDTLRGENGNDTLIPGRGLDTLIGGSGADIFRWGNNHVDSNVDKINDFVSAQGDKIDVSMIDADLTLAGDQAFTQGSYVNGILTGDIIGGGFIQIQLIGAPSLVTGVDVIL